MASPLPLRGLINVVDRALDPRTATRNARRAAADLAEHRRQLDDVDRAQQATLYVQVADAAITDEQTSIAMCDEHAAHWRDGDLV